MELDKRRVNDWIRIKFWDHCIEEGRPKHKKQAILCEVAGFVVQCTNAHVIISPWRCHHPDKKTVLANTEEYIIVRSAITEWGFTNTERWYAP